MQPCRPHRLFPPRRLKFQTPAFTRTGHLHDPQFHSATLDPTSHRLQPWNPDTERARHQGGLLTHRHCPAGRHRRPSRLLHALARRHQRAALQDGTFHQTRL